MLHPSIRTVCINLDKRTDRLERITPHLKDYQIAWERFPAIPREQPGKGIVGCGLSHLAVLKMARDQGWENVLILEDDFEFLETPDTVNNCINELFQSGVPFDVVMLSYNLHVSEEYNALLKRVKFAQTASGYIVARHYYDKLIELYEWALPLLDSTGQHWVYANDIVWKGLQECDNWYCFATRLGRQVDGYSDNAGCYINYNC